MRVKRADFVRVHATPEEIAEYQAKSGSSRPPAVPRARCVFCDTRIWYSGFAIGSHTKKCRAVTTWSDFVFIDGKYRRRES